MIAQKLSSVGSAPSKAGTPNSSETRSMESMMLFGSIWDPKSRELAQGVVAFAAGVAVSEYTKLSEPKRMRVPVVRTMP